MFSALIAKIAGSAVAKLIPWKWVGLGLGAVILAVLVCWLYLAKTNLEDEVLHLQERNTLLEAANAANLATISGMREADAAKDKALAAREKENRRINAERNEFQRRWQEAIRDDQETRDWADTRLPDAVRRLLQ